jgi:hypothetical protein
MAQYPAWDQMSDEQKFAYLREWCERLSRAIEDLRGTVQNLHERLRRVEQAASGGSP